MPSALPSKRHKSTVIALPSTLLCSLLLAACGHSTSHAAPSLNPSSSTSSSSTSATPTHSQTPTTSHNPPAGEHRDLGGNQTSANKKSAEASTNSSKKESGNKKSDTDEKKKPSPDSKSTTGSTGSNPQAAQIHRASNNTTPASQSSINLRAAHAASGAPRSVTSAKSSDMPVSISIPSIGLNHSVSISSGNASVLSPASGVIQQFVGYGRVLPGQPGISVMIGHITWNGPDVFYSLPRIQSGAAITVRYADGHTRTFRVTSKKSVNKVAEANDQSVWGNQKNTPVIALVTCDPASTMIGRHHTNNYVVIAQ